MNNFYPFGINRSFDNFQTTHVTMNKFSYFVHDTNCRTSEANFDIVYLSTPRLQAEWPDWSIYWTLGNFLKPLATINLSKSHKFLGNFCEGVKIYHFSNKIILGDCYRHLVILFWSHWLQVTIYKSVSIFCPDDPLSANRTCLHSNPKQTSI